MRNRKAFWFAVVILVLALAGLVYAQQPVTVANTPSVNAVQSGTWTVTGAGGTFPVTGTFFQATQPVSGGSNIFEVAPTTSANTAANTFFQQISDGTNPMGVMTNFGTTPTGVKALVANSSLFIGTVAAASSNGASGTGNARVNLANDNTAIANWGQGATGSAVPSGAQYIGGIGSGNLSGIIACDNSATVSMSTATTTQIVAISGSGGRTYICAINLVTTAANNVALISGSGSNCASNQAGLAGGTTAATGWNFAANGGLTIGTGLGMVFKSTTTNNEICLVTSAATQLSGTITWTQF